MKVAVVGATGLVGETLLRVLEQRGLPVSQLDAFASAARNRNVTFRGESYAVRATEAPLLQGHDAVFFAGSEDASEQYAPQLAQNGTVVIDNSSAFRTKAGVPLIVPEVNPQAFANDDRIFPVANCTAIILCVALAPVRNLAGLQRVTVATYQAVSGAGRAGLDELTAGEAALHAGAGEPAAQVFPAPIARNVVPQIGSIGEDGYTGEELKVRAETRKILSLPDLPLGVMTVRVPVRYAHSEAVFFETERATTLRELETAFKAAPGVVFRKDGIVTPRDVEGEDEVYVSRLRAEDESGRRFAMWVCGDQVRKGAAVNAVQILELLLRRGLVRA